MDRVTSFGDTSIWKRMRALFCVILFSQYSCFEALNITYPGTITIGALVDLNSTIGPAVKQSIELAVADVNKENRTLLHGSLLSLRFGNTNNNAFKAAAAAIELFKEEVVAIVGPQASTGSHFIAHIGSTLQVPVVSYGVTDPSLSQAQYPFFFRLSHNDVTQMKAIAALIKHFAWRTVVALYTDDDYGANGIAALEGALEQAGSSLLRKEPLAPGIDKDAIGGVLSRLSMMESRIFVVHAEQNVGRKVFAEAEYLGMIEIGFVWIVTDAFLANLNTQQLDLKGAKSMQGIIGIRRYIPQSASLTKFSQEWDEQITGKTKHAAIHDDLNVYALCAYDSVRLIARAMGAQLLENCNNFEFEDQPNSSSTSATASELSKLRLLKQGLSFRDKIIHTTLNGTTGTITLDKKGDIELVVFEIVNMIGRGMRVIGYWQNEAGITALPPDLIEQSDHFDQNHQPPTSQLATSAKIKPPVQLPDIIWPGGSTQVPRGWVIPQNGRPLIIGVPRKAGYMELIRQITAPDSNNFTTFRGFCIHVFESAIQYLPYAVTYQFVSYGSGTDTPVYDDLIRQLAAQEYDAVVGDATITTKRLDLVDFTQPYIESGLEIIVPWKSKRPNNEWAFLQPFTPTMWLATLAFFLYTGAVIWMLEHKMNNAFRGRPQKQIVTTLWFIFSTLFFAQREKTKTVLARAVLIIWLFVVLIITSSYTASLTSILTVQQLSPAMLGLTSLLTSDVPIGYQTGSFVKEYLIELGVKPDRLTPFSSKAMYAKALSMGPDNGGVAAIVDEHPYVQLFLASEDGAKFTTAGQQFTKSGWGFAFQKNSQLATDVSEAILRMSENGELQKIHNLWFTRQDAISKDTVSSSQLDLETFSGLFLITGVASVICLILYIARLLQRFNQSRAQSTEIFSTSRALSFSKSGEFLRSFALFLDKPAGRDFVDSKQQEQMAVSHGLETTPVSSLDRETV